MVTLNDLAQSNGHYFASSVPNIDTLKANYVTMVKVSPHYLL